MLSSNHYGKPAEKNEENSTFITIPLGITDGTGESKLTDLQDILIGQLPDGTYCLINNSAEEVL